MARQTVYIREEQVRQLLALPDAVAAVENALIDKAEGFAVMPPKLIVPLPGGDFRTMPAYLPRQNIAGVKVVNAHPHNRAKGLPTVIALLVLLEPDTGFPLAVVEATYLTALRTAAIGVLSVRALADPQARVAALIGAGVQARFQILALQEALPHLQQVRVWSQDAELAWDLLREMQPRVRFTIEVCPTPEAAVRGAQVVVTATPSRKPLVRAEWIAKGTHITCIGADAPGKQELDPTILRRARVFLDDLTQGMESGEVNVPLRQGLLQPDDIAGELGEVLVGKKPGRLQPDDITVFSSTGLAIQDIACGGVLLRKLGIIQ
ncbi:Delta(1)-pyrroline-2-carboxylate reductase [bacterium HR17]|uniref:Delta(1)-pyrroline-2-carboxylate reductase n=1 Tax=Candidatus Fervidibacter japonicus TaxID=2035412 RepID=A0A2H5XAM9_9BACT|nr:Delta(1)-pyrroline-2-carboxylate reductase [bacterium HR17]